MYQFSHCEKFGICGILPGHLGQSIHQVLIDWLIPWPRTDLFVRLLSFCTVLYLYRVTSHAWRERKPINAWGRQKTRECTEQPKKVIKKSY